MAVTEAIFRADHPEFVSTTTFPTAAINFYLNLAALLLNPDRWDDTPPAGYPRSMRDIGIELLVAHNLVLQKQSVDSAAAAGGTGTPGLSVGVLSSKSVGPASASYDTSAGMDPNAGHWNLTTYGLQFWKLVRLLGAGPFQLNIGIAPPFVGGAWQGPWPWPLPAGCGFSS